MWPTTPNYHPTYPPLPFGPCHSPEVPQEPLHQPGEYAEPPAANYPDFLEAAKRVMEPGSSSRLIIKLPSVEIAVGVGRGDWITAVTQLGLLTQAIQYHGLFPTPMVTNPIPREGDKTNNDIVIAFDHKEKNDNDTGAASKDSEEKIRTVEDWKNYVKKSEFLLFKEELNRETENKIWSIREMSDKLSSLQWHYRDVADNIETETEVREDAIKRVMRRFDEIQKDLDQIGKVFETLEDLVNAGYILEVPTVPTPYGYKHSPWTAKSPVPYPLKIGENWRSRHADLSKTDRSDVKGKGKEEAVDSHSTSTTGAASSATLGEAKPSKSYNLFAGSPFPPLVVNGTTHTPLARSRLQPLTAGLDSMLASHPRPMAYPSHFYKFGSKISARVRNDIAGRFTNIGKSEHSTARDGEAEKSKVQDDKDQGTGVNDGEDQKETGKKDCCCDDDDDKDLQDQDIVSHWDKCSAMDIMEFPTD
ncbi:hypothetical protein F5B22DRAFT_653227 [Xylaria bambusicola]|uniref:uncharacterized protein n=1 Tax=Xylaria bambusicola TaxID=326684 RepID=UPI00200780CB|nr:uncharacterized protein F5B22DRAFT_653227 [Xylaria bambusicola]KAI0528169.1 hypothetical protein F5B22DRAFT_653227 [Xylaria bambusicola]